MAAGFSIAVSIVVLIGWFTDVRWLTGAIGPIPPVVPNNAVMSLLAGMALWQVASPHGSHRTRTSARLCALAVIALALACGVEHVLGRKLVMDWLVPGPADAWPDGLSSPQSVFAYLFLGLGLLLIDRTVRGRRIADFFALGALLVATIALLGYLFDVPMMYGLPALLPDVGMSLIAALVVFVLATGLLAARAHTSVIAVVLARDPGGLAARRLLCGLLALPLVAIALLLGARARYYTDAFAFALVLLAALGEAGGMIVSTANRLSRTDAQLRASEARELLHAEQTAVTERQRRAELEALNGAVSQTVGELPRSDVDAVLRALAGHARALTGADYAAAATGATVGAAFDHWVSSGMADEVIAAIGRPPRATGVLGHVVATGEPFKTPRVEDHPAFRALPDGHPAITSFLAVPIKRNGRLVATLFVANKCGAHEFSQHDVLVVSALADRVAPAIETAILRESEARARAWLQAIIDQLPQGVIVRDDQEQVAAVNRAMLALGQPLTSGVGETGVFDIRDNSCRPVPFDDLPVIHALRYGETIRDRELQMTTTDGRSIPIAVSAGPVRDVKGHTIGAVAIISDISERKEAERMREEWIAVVAHDLRQPLNAILLGSDRLHGIATTEAQRADIERIRHAGWRLDRMVRDLLDAARISANRLALEPRADDVVALVRRVIGSAQAAGLAVELRLDGAERELVWIDDDRIQQVLDNLVSNAAKYGTPAAPIRIEIADRGAFVEVAVINEGPTLAPEVLARLFTKFSRTPNARSARVPGIGLGLYICKGLVEAHRGRIWADSAHGQTAFRFTLPRLPS